jgi:hypothetical protein
MRISNVIKGSLLSWSLGILSAATFFVCGEARAEHAGSPFNSAPYRVAVGSGFGFQSYTLAGSGFSASLPSTTTQFASRGASDTTPRAAVTDRSFHGPILGAKIEHPINAELMVDAQLQIETATSYKESTIFTGIYLLKDGKNT